MKRIAWLDIAKYICIMAVMLEHLESTTDEFGCFFSPFFVLCFFAAAGYTHRAGQAFRRFFAKKLRTLFVPWLIFSVLDIAVSQLVSFSEHAGFFEELFWNFLQIRGKGDQIWFVAALFVSFIPFYFFIEWYSKKPSGRPRALGFLLLSLLLFLAGHSYSKYMNPALLPWGTAALPWHLEYIFQGMFYMTLGYLFRERWEGEFDRCNTLSARIILILFYSVIIYLPYFVSVHEAVFGFFAVFITPVVGIALVFALSKVIAPNPYMLYIGQNTLIYFALHGKLFSFVEGMLVRFAPAFYQAVLADKLVSNLFALAFTLFLSVVLLLPAYLINRYLPFLLGRRPAGSLMTAGTKDG